jgi:hypothetical protein
MKTKLLIASSALLFLCTSIYLGTGVSLVLFSFPIAPKLTPANYYMQFVPQVQAATQFFTYMTTLMIVLAIVMLIAEWRTSLRWVPATVLAGIIAATALTLTLIFPYNQEMARGITDPERLAVVLGKWMTLNRIRVAIWGVQWLAMMTYFGVKALRESEVSHAR